MTTINNNNFDAYIAWYPDYPSRIDSRYKQLLNPDNFFTTTGKAIKEGDLVQPVYVWDKEGRGFWSDRFLEVLDNQPFPRYLPLRDLLSGKEGENIEIEVLGRRFNFRCAQRLSKNPESDFENFYKYLNNFYVYPERELGEAFSPREELNSWKYIAMVEKVKASQLGTQGLPASIIEKIYYDATQSRPMCSNAILKKIYKREKRIGAGGEGEVLKITDQKTQQVRAFKISHVAQMSPEVIAVVNFILDQEISPHLTRVFKVLKIPSTRNIAETNKEFDKAEADNFVKENKDDEKPLIKMGYEMELLDGDLEEIQNGLTEQEEMAIAIQVASVHCILNQHFETHVLDDKSRNILYKRLDETITFNGHKLIDCDYWKYTFEGKEFYIPKQKYFVKLGDYDSWVCDLFDSNAKNTVQHSPLQQLGARIDLNKAAELFKKPDDPKAKILDMGNETHIQEVFAQETNKALDPIIELAAG